VYLLNSEYNSRDNLRIYGSPYSPEFFNWAFNAKRGDAIRRIWDQIPTANKEVRPVDILIVHTPPLGRGDLTEESGRVGCYDLLKVVQERVKPRLCIFGHIHEGYGTSYDGEVLYVNASSVNVRYEAVNHPIVVDISHEDQAQRARVVTPRNSKVTCKIEFEAWCKEHKFDFLAQALERYDGDNIPVGDQLLNQTVFWTIADLLGFHRSKVARDELQLALSRLYAESFE
jgi:hypothetical protein